MVILGKIATCPACPQVLAFVAEKPLSGVDLSVCELPKICLAPLRQDKKDPQKVTAQGRKTRRWQGKKAVDSFLSPTALYFYGSSES